MNLGEFLHAKNIVTKNAIEEALAVQRYTRAPLGRILRDLGYLGQNDLNLWLTRFLEPICTDSSQQLKEAGFG